MEWLWEIYKEYVTKQFEVSGHSSPSNDEVQELFLKMISESTVTVLVQEPWHNSIQFKGLARYNVKDNMKLINHTMDYLLALYGGGKYKLNFHHGWNFIGTRNFKPEGEPKWEDLPRISF